jgi:LPXTG-motif cell wall-anchored protein
VRPATSAGQPGAPLPKTATDAELRILFGLMLVVASVILLMIRRRRYLVARWRAH